ncbi:GntR family transcriptional regulator [Nocardia terpenica]|uniref:GntR family transcriptional regulator n=1 Tax=Nocardia terpenica TaxID=455432 RepID=UPI001893F645|nr:GntR family transcriptional regulator [Nocardia terpenica]MBF6060793.1 GntR family transcriptional regulator [Nocardia terpenica]MBF6104053.1 GntR family transcriptional regulator [Nocardia terpenica]MBF6111573.1 GntR family transcriptional regulator [Nocardia terpenica]MBF6118274.1 GntR family transcriptional regulator [Nocardia terpenica]MBF6156101.1 GntR family transcriptional regulator [Nocardia terpenica]
MSREIFKLPKYQAIASDILQKIADGTFPVGSKVPSMVELTAQYRVAPNTVGRAIDMLRELGVVESRLGIGTFVLTAEVEQEVSLATRVSQLEAQMAELIGLLTVLKNL